MDPFMSLSFVQAVVPSTANQIAQCLSKVDTSSFANLNFPDIRPVISSFRIADALVQDLASKFIRAALPAAQCKCGAIIIGSVQEDEFTCLCGRTGSIGHLKRSSDVQWVPHPFASCSACHTWNLLGTSGSIERCACHRESVRACSR